MQIGVGMGGSGYIFTATRENFETLVLQNSRRGLVLVDFWSPRAGPSLRQREVLIRLANAMEGRFLLATVNTDEQKRLAEEFAVRSLPSFKLFRNGRVVEEVRGMQPEADYRKIVERHLAGPADEVQQAALQLWQAGEHDKAIQLLAQGAMEDPENPRLPLLMAKLLMRQQRYQDAHEIVSAVPAPARDDPELAQLAAHLGFIVCAAAAPGREELTALLRADAENWRAHYQLAAVLLVQDEISEAMEQLMVIQRNNPGFDHGAARKGLLALFNMMDAGDQRVKRFRAELFNLTH